MNKDLQMMKVWVLDRIGHFLAEIEFEQDSLKIEAKLYTIASTANHAYATFHKNNCSAIGCDHSFMKEAAVRL